jgi:hypothetical protein
MVSWTIEDDQGRPHNIIIPDVPMSPGLLHHLLLPQHWAQETDKFSRTPLLGRRCPCCNTNASKTTLTWGWGKFTKTVSLDPARNVVVMSTKAGIKKYTAFATKVEQLEPNIYCFATTGIPEPTPTTVTDTESTDDESTGTDTSSTGFEPEVNSESKIAATKELPNTEECPPEPIDFESHPESAGISIEHDEPLKSAKDKLYHLHGVHAGHLYFAKLKTMAKQVEIPSALQHCAAPMCAACQFGKATHRPWHTKTKNRTIRKATKPGECVLVNQMESCQVGFIAQLKGHLTKGRYCTATIFVNHHS